jgi:ADP-dependent NAD(P)H-hydrate dehydratase / NAD(P)H-hydrate epimerase
MSDPSVAVLDEAWAASRLPPRPERSHKGDFGRVLVVAGSIEYPGAAVLTALGAMRTGAGLVRVAAAESVVARLAGAVPEVTWMALDEEAPGLIAPGGWRRLAAEATDHDAAVIGPGLGRQPAMQRRSRQLIAGIRIPTVVDADALNALAEERRWWQSLRSTLVLTPHPGEFSRLTRSAAPDGEDDAARTAAAAEAAAVWGQVVVLKGAHTVVADADGTVARSDVAAPALATAGSGDVLAGTIGALLAAGVAPFDAAACAVALHAAAGLEVTERIGRAGALASDVAHFLPRIAERLRSSSDG